MPSWIDGALYPDVEPPDTITTIEERIDFLSRVCGAWDFGILPEPETVTEIQRCAWREAVDATQFLTSLSYHLVRQWHGLPQQPYLGSARSLPINQRLRAAMQISETEVERLSEMVRPAEEGGIIQEGAETLSRRAVLEAAREAGASATAGPNAARSQDFLYGDDGLPR